MGEKFLTIKFGIIAVVSIAVWMGTYFTMRNYWSARAEVKMKSDFVKVPINNTLTVMGIVCPLLIGLVSYFYTNAPNADYSFILAAITLFVAVLFLAIWETFSLLSMATPEDNVALLWSTDAPILVGLGIMYSSLVLGFIYLILFFLLNLPFGVTVRSQAISNYDIALAKPLPLIGQSKTDILAVLGAPSKYISEDTLKYQGPDNDTELQFDKMGKLQKIIQQRR